MNLILLDPAEARETVRLDDHRHTHIRTVLKADVGQSLKVGVYGANKGEAVILSSDNRQTTLGHLRLDQPPPVKLPLTVLLALPRPKAARRLCRTLAELGAEKLILLNSYRVEKSYWQSPLLTPEKIRQYFVEGLEQAGDTVLPEIEFEKRFKPFVEDRLPALIANSRALVAHPYGRQNPIAAQNQKTVLAIGPEGGFIPYEFEKLQAAGMRALSLGDRILRVETAVPTLLAKLF